MREMVVIDLPDESALARAGVKAISGMACIGRRSDFSDVADIPCFQFQAREYSFSGNALSALGATYPKCSISNSVRTRTLRVEC
jgi:hypothetical protein